MFCKAATQNRSFLSTVNHCLILLHVLHQWWTASWYLNDRSIIENIWPSATTLRSSRFDWGQPNITGNCRNGKRKLPFIVCTSCSNYNTVDMPPWNTPLCLLYTCVRTTNRSAEITDVAFLSYHLCIQTSAAARVARLWPISDVPTTQLLLGD